MVAGRLSRMGLPLPSGAAAHRRSGRGPRLRVAILLSLLFLLLLPPLPCAARGWIDRMSVLEDASAQLTLEQVIGRSDWRPVDGPLSLGFTSAALWIRLEPSPATPAEPLRLRIRPAYLDQIEVFAPDGANGWIRQVRGDWLPAGGNRVGDTAFSAAVEGRHSGPIYVRVRSTSTMAVYPELRDEAESFRVSAAEHLIFGVYFGLMCFLAFWAFTSAWVRRDAALAVFGLYLLALIGMGLGITGLAAAFLLKEVGSHYWTTLFVLLASPIGGIFHRVFLLRFHPRRWSLWLVDLCIGAGVVNLTLLALIDARTVLAFNAWLVLIGCVAVSLAAFMPGAKTRAEHRTLLIAYGLMLVTLSLTMLPVVGAGVGGALAIHLTMGHGLIVALTLSIALARLARLDSLERQRLELAAEQSRRELAIISAQNREYDQFLAMLTHELRNALSTAALVIRRLSHGEYLSIGPSRTLPADAATGAPASDSEGPLASRPRTDIVVSLSRADSALRAASAVIDKVQAARQIETGAAMDSAAALLADQVLEAADRLGVDDLEIEIEPTLALRQDWTYADLILSNLIENAHRYREAGSLIRITARKRASSAGGIELSVTNRCNPAARIDPDKVFEKYWRDPHASSQRGAGLGLWLSRNAARMLGGDLRCSVRDASISFVLELPDR